ncbi:MAG: DNA-processing protein DprA [Nocardioidaceae bacterium]
MSDRVARAGLSRLAEPGDTRVAALVADLGAETVYEGLRQDKGLAAAIEREPADGWGDEAGGLRSSPVGAAAGAVGGAARDLAGEVAARARGLDPEAELAEAERRGIRFVCPGDDEWPEPLDALGRCEPVQGRGGVPLGLWVRGPLSLAEAARHAVAVVGSRSATSYGAGVAADIAAHLGQHGVTVVSGAAFGIDQAAHRGALAVRGPTVAVLACGVDRAYPAAHRNLLDYVADVGAVVSELPPGCAPTKVRFLSRNRVIAALGQGTVVVEAAVRSGALNTANWAGRLGRVLMGVPGPVTSAPSEGVHELLRSRDAALVTRGSDVLELVSPAGTHLTEHRRGPDRARDRLSPGDLQVLEAVPLRQPASSSSVARTAGLGHRPVVEALVRLRGAGLVEECDGRWRLAGEALP